MTSVAIGYLGPEGTFSHEAVLSALAEQLDPPPAELVPFASIHETVTAVGEGRVQRALVPIENSLEGSVNETLDTLVHDATNVHIAGERVQPIEHCLVSAADVQLDRIRVVLSVPIASAQCARFLREHVPGAELRSASSTAEAVRIAVTEAGASAAIGSRLAAERYGGHVLAAGIEDVAGNETRFVWLVREARSPVPGERARTALVFSGAGAGAPGWLHACLGELAERNVNLTRIESRPDRQGLGGYLFFIELDGGLAEEPVAGALRALRRRVGFLRILGSFEAAPGGS